MRSHIDCLNRKPWRLGRVRRNAMCLLLPLLCLAPLSSHAATVELSAKLSAGAQVPANPSKGQGEVKIQLDTEKWVMTWSGTYAGLTGQPIAAHFHGPADATKNAPVVVNIDPLASPFSGTATLTPPQAEELLAGRWYVNVHTPSFPGGEIRGQVQRVGN